jgi:DeoR family glycerol-3-phosphate regulon repressor
MLASINGGGPDAPRAGELDLNLRQDKLLRIVRASGAISLEELAHGVGATVQTIRRDVQQLADAGLLVRFRGGVRASGTTENITYQQRQTLHSDAKERIARAVAQRVPNDASIALTVGTTTGAVARALVNHKGLRVVTNDMVIAQTLSVSKEIDVQMCGGFVRGRDYAIVGEAAVQFIDQFRFDIAIVGVAGIEADGSLRDFDYREVKVTQAAITHSRQVWVVADHSKFTRRAMVEVTSVSRIDGFFTDEPPPEAMRGLFEEAHVTVEVAS